MLNPIIDVITAYTSEIAFFLSLASFTYTFLTSKSRLKIKVKFYTYPNIEDEHYHLLFDCSLFNKSKYPITISKIELNGCKVYDHKVHLGDGTETVFGQEIYGEGNTQELPFKLDLFDSKDVTFLVRDRKHLKYHHLNLIKIYTSRGVMYYIRTKHKLKQSLKK